MDAFHGCTGWRRMGWRGVVGLGLLVCWLTGSGARAAGPNEPVLDAPALAQMEVVADKANPRDQVYLYTELLHGMTELAGRQMAAGQDEEATQTVAHMEAVVTKVQNVSDKNAKRLKNAEELLQHTAHRLSDMVKVASGEERNLMQGMLQKLNHIHSSILSLVFAQ